MFQCYWVCANGLRCNALIRGYNLSTHLREVHGVHGSDKSRVPCCWMSCNMELNKESLTRHIEEVHLMIAHQCVSCGATFSRRDTLSRHNKKPCSG
ncbi:hypothetical protein P692DRAFT_20730885 [Suillus brevipes Sb2]|nr:hypothetical protein P692DRAFT_20730885 [Suillus brevipes Sb2]